MFNIDSILKDPIYMPGSQQTAQSTETENAFPSLSFDVVDEPVDMVRCANEDLSIHVPNQLKQKFGNIST